MQMPTSTLDHAATFLEFDEGHYKNPLAYRSEAGKTALEHYLAVGWKACRNPSAEFDTVFYYMSISGFCKPEMCPLEHFNMVGGQAPRNRAEAVEWGLPEPDVEELVASLPELSELFDATYYVRRYPDAITAAVPPLHHFLGEGWKTGRNPSENFETLFYRKRFMHNDTADVCPLLHYLRFGRPANLPTTFAEARRRTIEIRAGKSDPTEAQLPSIAPIVAAALMAPHFSAPFYISEYLDIAQAKVDPYWHYSTAGWEEGRSPLPGFDLRWYSSRFIKRELRAAVPPLLHIATVGRLADLPLSQSFNLARTSQALDALWTDQLQQFLRDIGVDTALYEGDWIRRALLPMFSAEDYRAHADLDDRLSNVAAFLRYLTVDLPGGLPPGPMFSARHYLSEVQRLHLPLPKSGESPFLHWLTHGLPAGASPNPAFVNQDYVELNEDLSSYPDLLFYHFIEHGLAEQRRFSRLAYVAPSPTSHLRAGRPPRAIEFCNVAARATEKSDEFAQMRDFWSSGRFEKTVADAVKIEPDVGAVPENVVSMIPPWQDEMWVVYSDMLKLLPEGQFDALVLMPFCKLGGADFVGGVLASELSRNQRTILIRTDADDWERPDWFAPEVTTLDLSQYFAVLSPGLRQRALYCLILRLGARNVFNVNSRLAFETFDTYGERLGLSTRLHTYYFCADRTEDGIESGYPVWYFSRLLPFLTTAMIDNTPLATQLVERFSLSGPMRDRVRVFFTPAMTDCDAEMIAERQAATAVKRRRSRILWAGRFDRQKRFDLLVEIARLMPEVDFVAWGKAVLDAPPDMSDLPKNLTVKKPFDRYDDLPLADSDGWLYTSAWDGIPTILVELGARAVPIVASSAGGVAELIDETTGWPVDAGGDAQAYADALKEMLNTPEERVRRAAALRDRVQSRHSLPAYATALKATIRFLEDNGHD